MRLKKFFLTVLGFFLLALSTSKTNAAYIDISESVDINGYDVNVSQVVAEDSILWPLLDGFTTLRNNTDTCRANTTTLVTAQEAQIRALFPWFWDSGDDVTTGVNTFCDLLGSIPTYLGLSIASEGVFGPADGDSTNIFSSSVVPDWNSVENFTLDHPDVKIEFTGDMDLLSYEFIHMLISFNEAFDAEDGFISFDSDLITGLKTMGAVITFKNITDFDDPVILVNGEENESVVSGLTYDPVAQILVFNAAHFTSFQVAERSDNAKIKSWKAEKYRTKTEDQEIKIRLELKGKHFSNDTVVRIGGEKADRIRKVNSKKLIAWFTFDDLMKKYDPRRRITVETGDNKKRSSGKINLKKIDWRIENLDFNSSATEGVINIQKVLYNEELLKEENIIGVYGPITTEAVRMFQSRYGISQTGFVGPLTQAKMIEIAE